MEELLFKCDECYQIIDDYKKANVVYKVNQNGVFIGPKVIHRDIHEGKFQDYKWFKLKEINDNIFHIFIEYDIYKNNQNKIPVNFLDNWLNFVLEVNNKYYQTKGESSIYISYKGIKDITDNEKERYYLDKLIKKIDEIDEIYNSKIIKNLLKVNDNLFYDKDDFKFYDSKNNEFFSILDKSSGGKIMKGKPKEYDKIILIIFMYLFENNNDNNHIKVCDKEIFKLGIDYIYNDKFLKNNYIDYNDNYEEYFFNDMNKKLQNLVESLNNNLKTSFKTYSNGIIVG